MSITVLVLTILFIFGLSIGSFINAFEYRLHEGLDFVKARSMCPKCKHILGTQDLVPLLSYLLLGGKCRYCKTKISWQYPIIEFLTGILFVLSGCFVLTKMESYEAFDILKIILFSFLIGLILSVFLFFALYDLKYKIVPQKVIIPLIFLYFVFILFCTIGIHFAPDTFWFSLFFDSNPLLNVVAGIIGGIFIAFIIIITKGKGMGGGDMKMLVFMGLVLGWKKLIIAFYISVILGAVVGILWGIYKRQIKGLKIPFALFLSIGTIIAFLWGGNLWDRYFEVLYY